MKWQLVSLAVFFALTSRSTFAEDAPHPNQVLKSDGGRYVFGQTSIAVRHTWMLDTSTGRLWQLVLDAKTNEFVLTPVRYRMLSGAESLDAPLANSEVDDYQAKKGPKTTGNPKQSAEQFLDAAGFPVKPAPIKASTPTPKTP